jgi:hypothetical protein
VSARHHDIENLKIEQNNVEGCTHTGYACVRIDAATTNHVRNLMINDNMLERDDDTDYVIELNSTDAASLTTTFDFVDGDVTVGTDTIAETSHGLVTGDKFVLTTTGALPTGLSASTDYYCIRVDADNFKVAASLSDAEAGTAVDITAAAGGGTHTLDSTALIAGIVDVTIKDNIMVNGLQIIKGVNTELVKIHDNRMSGWLSTEPITVDGSYNEIGDNGLIETVDSNGAVVTLGLTLIDSSGGAVSATLADGQAIGQRKKVGMSDASNASTLEVANHETTSPETFNFAQVTDYLILEWMGSQWVTVANSGAAT